MGNNLFAHGGLLPHHLSGGVKITAKENVCGPNVEDAEAAMEVMNAAACSWLLNGGRVPDIVYSEDSPIWTRLYSFPDCEDLEQDARMQLEEVSLFAVLEHSGQNGTRFSGASMSWRGQCKCSVSRCSC